MSSDQPGRATVVVVLGMHKSGTSLISEILHHSGIEMLEEESTLGYDQGFHHERRATSDINKDLLRSRGLHSLETIRKLDLDNVDQNVRTVALQFVAAMADRDLDWGFKDPRTCLTYDLWRSILPAHKLVCVFRDAPEVLQHYARTTKGSPFRALRAWFEYNKAMLEAYQRTPEADRRMIHYRSFMASADGLETLSTFIGRPLADRRSERLMRSKDKSRLSYLFRTRLHRMISSQDVAGLNRSLRRISASEQRRLQTAQSLLLGTA